MADNLKLLALKADAALSAFYAEAEANNKLWPSDSSAIAGALSVVRGYQK